MLKIFSILILGCLVLPADLPGESIYNLSSTWKDREGHTLQLKDYQGSKVILAMVYLSCPQTCPLLVEDLKRAEKHMTERQKTNLKFLLVSFDPDRDTPEKMREFSQKHKIDRSNWNIVTGSPIEIRKLAALLKVSYVKAKNEFSHTALITLLDEKGIIKKQIEGSMPDPQILTNLLTEK